MKTIATNIIVKIQLPLAGEPQVYIYSEGKKYEAILPLTPDAEKPLRALLMGKPKGFAYADVVRDPNGELTFDIGGRAPWQQW